MKILLEEKEALEMFHTALCNGLSWVRGYDLTLEYDSKAYLVAVAKLESPCFEDVLIQILVDGGKLSLQDEEGDEVYEIGLSDLCERMANVPLENILNIVNENDDAYDADAVLQTVFIGEIIFG